MYVSSYIIFTVVFAPTVLAQALRNGESNTTCTDLLPATNQSRVNNDMSKSTSELDCSPFPPGDVLNNPWLRKIRFCVDLCFDEEKLQGLRNLWPHLYPITKLEPDGRILHYTRPLSSTYEIAINPALHAKQYCMIYDYPNSGKHSIMCLPGNHSFWGEPLNSFPMAMLRKNIPQTVFNATLAFFSLLLGIFGNILIIISILTKKELKSATNYLLLGMAVADCMNSITIVFYGYLQTFLLTIIDPILGPLGCAIVKSIKELSQLSAVNHLLTLSFERYFAICWPMKKSLKFTPKKTILILIMNWLIAGVQLVPFVLIRVNLDMTNYPDYFCFRPRPTRTWKIVFTVYNLTVYLLLPLPILCYNYVCVVRSLLYSIKKSHEMTGDSSGQTQAEKARLRLTYMMITLVVIYVLTVTPGRILDALWSLGFITFRGDDHSNVRGSVDLLRGLNSWTNVVVYAIVSRQFRRAFKEILCHCWIKQSRGDSGNQSLTQESFASGTMDHKA